MLAVLVLASATSFSQDINLKKLNKTKWYSVTTESFNVVTDAGEKKGKALASELERFRYFLTEVLKFNYTAPTVRTPILLAKSNRTFKNLGIKTGYTGVFSQKNSKVSIVANGSRFSKTSKANPGRQTIFHEIVHLITHTSDQPYAVPPWFSEGIAEYFGTYYEKDDAIILGRMDLLQYRFRSLYSSSGRWLGVDVENLLKTGKINISERQSKKNDEYVLKFYARSFALVHYLNADPDRRKKMYIYLLLLHKGHSIDDSFTVAFETTYDQLSEEVDEYIQGKYVYSRVFKIGENGIKFPNIDIAVEKLKPRQAMEFIVPKLMLIGPPLISHEAKDSMLLDMRELYPGMSILL